MAEPTEEEEEVRVQYVHSLLGISENSTKPPIKCPSAIRDDWDVIAPRVALDGACVTLDTG